MPRVSIGVPVYNGENYLGEALSSLLGQTFGDLEVIVSDNASTDGTETIVREVEEGDRRVRYHRQPSNLGAAGNYNFTLAQATGDFFMWAAHDDLRDPGFVEQAVQTMDQQPGASCVFSRSRRIAADGSPLQVMIRPDELMSPDPATRMRATIGCRHPGVIIFGLIPTELLRRTSQHPDFPGGDRVLAVELALAGPFIELPDVLFLNRDHPNRYVRIKEQKDAGRKRLQEAWWDPGRVDRIVFPAWRRFRSYASAITRSSLSRADQRRCYSALVAATTDKGFAIPRGLAKDLVVAGATAVRKVAS